jgi:2-polyprenyl-6-methoxyphenol hydroxylase-like FAD-dependent oxidoreductase
MTMPETPLRPRNSPDCDVLIVGGGPAGSTIAALVAEKGWSVTLLEKEHHPRFHIGESLLPLNLPILQRLGVLEQVAAIGIKSPARTSTPTWKCRDTIVSISLLRWTRPTPTRMKCGAPNSTTCCCATALQRARRFLKASK